MSNGTNGTVVANEILIQETFNAYVGDIRLEYLILTLRICSFVENWITASTISELTTYNDQKTKRKALALLLYTIILNISQEIEYMWLKSFSFPTLFYVLTRYTVVIEQGLSLAINLLPSSTVSHSMFSRISV